MARAIALLASGHRLARVVEGPAAGLHGRQPAQLVGVPLGRQVQCRVGRVQVPPPGFAVGDAGHVHLAEDRGQGAGVPGLGAGPAHPVGVADPLDPGFALCTQVQVVLEQLAEQLPVVDSKPFLELAVGQCARLLAVQEPQHRLEPVP